MYNLTGNNPSEMYLKATRDLVKYGDKVSPRGKLVAELRPACLEFRNPYNRVPFLEGRRINPFFQLAESLWILSGRADVEFLAKFNENMKQFSDDGKWFNAPYGERIRMWNKNSAHNFIFNPIDQLSDVYKKLVYDKDTRQAVIVISNPLFDNSNYTIDEKGLDIACNLVLTFKIRQDKLNMTVFNRSNDLHWGVFGANLCQFSTIQECLLAWLKAYRYPELEIGTYNQITDSLHIYLDDYGCKITDDILAKYKDKPISDVDSATNQFNFKSEPRMTLAKGDFDAFITAYWNILNPYLMDDDLMKSDSRREEVFGENGLLYQLYKKDVIDNYWLMAIQAMVAYRLVKLGLVPEALIYLRNIVSCQWKVSMMYFLKKFIRKLDTGEGTGYQRAANAYLENARGLKESLVDSSATPVLEQYLYIG